MVCRLSVPIAALIIAVPGFTPAAGLAAQDQGDAASVKGIYREAQKPGVKYAVYKRNGTDRVRVGADYEFKSDDRFEIELETNKASYVYVLNRTFAGEPGELSRKGIERIRDDDHGGRGSKEKYKLLYPLGKDPKTTSASAPFRLPVMHMDDQPGVEKMFIVVSAKPIKIDNYFDVNGDQRRSPSAGGGRHVDSEDDVLDQLNKELVSWKDNSEIVQAKGISRDSEGYGVVRDSAKPGMLELTLQHHPKR